MSAFGGGMKFAIEIGAQDRTEAGLRSVVARFRSFARTAVRPITVPIQIARGGLGLLRDINLGLAPLVRGLDNLIERGAGLEVIRNSFASLTGVPIKDARILANQLVNASNGMLGFGRAMAVANRGLAGGLNIRQIGTVLDFISKKSVATGKDAGQALDTVITGLSRGSTLFLDDFGILVDGIEGVRDAYDRLRGGGSFDKLLPSEQKTETVRQALAEMAAQSGKLNVSGNETVFIYARLKNQFGDVVDKLSEAVAKSGALNEFMRSISDAARAIQRNFESGGGFGGLLFGHKGMPGALDFAAAFFQDLGEALGAGFIEEVGKGLNRLGLPGFGGGGPGGAGGAGGAAAEFTAFRRTRDLWERLRASGREDAAGADALTATAAATGMPLTQTAMRRLRSRIGIAESAAAVIRRGGRGTRQQALLATDAEVNRLRREGFDVRPADRRRIFNEQLNREIQAELEGTDKAPGPARLIRDLRGRLTGSEAARTARNEQLREERQQRRADLLERRRRRREIEDLLGPTFRANRVGRGLTGGGTIKLSDFPDAVREARREELGRTFRNFDSKEPDDARRAVEDAAKSLKESATSIKEDSAAMRLSMDRMTVAVAAVSKELSGFSVGLEAAGGHRQ